MGLLLLLITSEVVSRLVYDANIGNDFTIVKTFKDFKNFE